MVPVDGRRPPGAFVGLSHSGPVAALDPRVAPRVYQQDGFAVTLWTYYGPQTSRKASPADYANALERLHAGMRRVAVTAPHFTDRVAEAQQLVSSGDRTPAHADVDRELATLLARIPHAPCAIVSLGYRREQIEHPLDGFGFVVPLIERRQILSCSFSSVKYPGRAPDGSELVRVYIGGACQAELAQLPDQQLRAIAVNELRE